MIITRATEYAIRAVLYLAQQPPGNIVLKKDICHAQQITPAFLTKILQPLIHAGLIGSQRGVGGGFYLVADPADITLYHVYSLVEDDLHLNICLDNNHGCPRQAYCPVHDVWQEVRQQLQETLQSYTFAHLAAREKEKLQSLKTAPHDSLVDNHHKIH